MARMRRLIWAYAAIDRDWLECGRDGLAGYEPHAEATWLEIPHRSAGHEQGEERTTPLDELQPPPLRVYSESVAARGAALETE